MRSTTIGDSASDAGRDPLCRGVRTSRPIGFGEPTPAAKRITGPTVSFVCFGGGGALPRIARVTGLRDIDLPVRIRESSLPWLESR
jgi:hypothetical protein